MFQNISETIKEIPLKGRRDMLLTGSSVKKTLLPGPPYLITFGCQKISGILQNSRGPLWGSWHHWCWPGVWHR